MPAIRGGIVAENSTVWRSVGQRAEDRLDVLGEAHVEHLVGLVEDDGADAVDVERPATEVVEDPTRGADDDVDAAFERLQLAEDRLAAVDRDDLDTRAGGRT